VMFPKFCRWFKSSWSRDCWHWSAMHVEEEIYLHPSEGLRMPLPLDYLLCLSLVSCLRLFLYSLDHGVPKSVNFTSDHPVTLLYCAWSN
jgi:hypothetical protein